MISSSGTSCVNGLCFYLTCPFPNWQRVPWPLKTNSNNSKSKPHQTMEANHPAKTHTFHLCCDHPHISSGFCSPQAETLTEAGKEILTFHHEGFFWRCWFFGEGQPETIWTFWYSEYPRPALAPPLRVWFHSSFSSPLCQELIWVTFSVLFYWLGFCWWRAVCSHLGTPWCQLKYHLWSLTGWCPPPASTALPIPPDVCVQPRPADGACRAHSAALQSMFWPLGAEHFHLHTRTCGLLGAQGLQQWGPDQTLAHGLVLLGAQDLCLKILPVLLFKLLFCFLRSVPSIRLFPGD